MAEPYQSAPVFSANHVHHHGQDVGSRRLGIAQRPGPLVQPSERLLGGILRIGRAQNLPNVAIRATSRRNSAVHSSFQSVESDK